MAKLNPFILIGTPCYGGMVYEPYFTSMMYAARALMAHNIMFNFGTISNESLITRARNNIVHNFLKHDNYTHLMFIDADINFQETAIPKLLSDNKPVVGATYPMKRLFLERMPLPEPQLYDYAGNIQPGAKKEGDLVLAKDVPNGFMMIQRSVLEAMVKAYPELAYHYEDGVTRYALFDTMIEKETGNYLSEDFAFCRRWQALGGECWLDLSIKLDHCGSYFFRGDPGHLK